MPSFTGYTLYTKKEENRDRGDDSVFGTDSEDEAEDIFEGADFDFSIKKPARQLRQVVQEIKELQRKDGSFYEKPGVARVRGKFDPLFSEPWWRVELQVNTVKSSKHEKMASSLPSYMYRTDDGVGKDILSLFLQACEVHEQNVTMFLEFIRNNNLRPSLNSLLENLNQFSHSSEDHEEVAHQIQTSLHHAPTGKAFLVPEFTRFAHRLLPRHVRSIFDECSLEVLQELERAINMEPWIFGYWTVLSSRYDLSGCEAKLTSFQECDLFQKMPVSMQDALRIYHKLCEKIRKFGHTYVYLSQLKGWETNVKHWEESLSYLSSIDAVETCDDHLGDERIVFLPYLRQFEQRIANNLSCIMHKEPWIGNIDVEQQEFEGDEDQIKAAKLITEKPVVVMSGRGGCGKTFVVSKVLLKALERKKEEIRREFCDDVDDQLMPGIADTVPKEAKPCHSLIPDTQGDKDSMKKEVFQDFCDDLDDSHAVILEDIPEEAMSCHSWGLNMQADHDKDSTHQKEVTREIKKKQKEVDEAVLLTAPTGKAASILGSRIGLEAYTLHSVIYSFINWEQKSQEENDWKFHNVRLLVCDECSLVSVKVFSKLLSCLTKWSELQQVILLGDINQLPSIEPGNFLCDVYQTLAMHGVSVTLKTNHRSDSDLIVQNAVKISQPPRQMPHFNPLRRFHSVAYPSFRGDKQRETDIVKQVINNVLKREELQDPKSSQFVAFRNVDCNLINEQCARHYNNHSLLSRKPDYQTGDKICIRRNVECNDVYGKKPVRLCNGEIFFIHDITEEQDSRGKKKVYFSLDSGQTMLKISFRELKAAKLCHAWARTIHTFQGSEIETLVYVVGRPHYQNWQHVYTAITRGIRRVIIIHNPSYLQKAIHTCPEPRQTKLKEDITRQLHYCDPPWSEGDSSEASEQTGPQRLQSNLMHDSVHQVESSDPCGLARGSDSSNHHTADQERPYTNGMEYTVDQLRLRELEACFEVSWSDDDDDGLEQFDAQEAQSNEVKTIAAYPKVDNAHSWQEERVDRGQTNVLNVSNIVNLEESRAKEDSTSRLRTTSPGTSTQTQQTSSSVDGALPSSPLKRKHPDSENSEHMFPSKAPPQSPLNCFASSLSSVSPLKHNSLGSRKVILADFRSRCRICKTNINIKDKITYFNEGSRKCWIHSECA